MTVTQSAGLSPCTSSCAACCGTWAFCVALAVCCRVQRCYFASTMHFLRSVFKRQQLTACFHNLISAVRCVYYAVTCRYPVAAIACNFWHHSHNISSIQPPSFGLRHWNQNALRSVNVQQSTIEKSMHNEIIETTLVRSVQQSTIKKSHAQRKK